MSFEVMNVCHTEVVI